MFACVSGFLCVHVWTATTAKQAHEEMVELRKLNAQLLDFKYERVSAGLRVCATCCTDILVADTKMGARRRGASRLTASRPKNFCPTFALAARTAVCAGAACAGVLWCHAHYVVVLSESS